MISASDKTMVNAICEAFAKKYDQKFESISDAKRDNVMKLIVDYGVMCEFNRTELEKDLKEKMAVKLMDGAEAIMDKQAA
jgi:hypothetical protein